RAGPGVRARAAHSGADVVDDVLDARTLRIQAHPRGGDVLLELRLERAVERVPTAGAGFHGALGRHAEALLVGGSVGVVVQVAGSLVGAGEPGADHHVRGPRGQCERDVARIPDAAVGPHVAAGL